MESSTKQEVINEFSPLESNLFDDTIEDYTCSICTLVPNPHSAFDVPCCGHLFCEECIKKWISSHHNCPLCKASLKDNEQDCRKIESKNKIVYRILTNFKIKCPYKCSWTDKWSSLEAHLKQCPNGICECKYKSIGCNFVGKGTEYNLHILNAQLHLDMAMNIIKEGNINPAKRIKFDEGEVHTVSCHPHPLTFMRSLSWGCDARRFPGGCLSPDPHFTCPYRYRCHQCDFDLCVNCMMKYLVK